MTRVVLGELGTGGHQAFEAGLIAGRCYTVIVVGLSEDLELDLLLSAPSGEELDRDNESGPTASIDLCPVVDGAYRATVRVYRGQGPFAVQVFGL